MSCGRPALCQEGPFLALHGTTALVGHCWSAERSWQCASLRATSLAVSCSGDAPWGLPCVARDRRIRTPCGVSVPSHLHMLRASSRH